MLWLFEKDTFDEDNPQKMKDIAESMGHETHWVNYIPFGGGLDIDAMPKLKHDEFWYFHCDQHPVVAYGSLGLANHINKEFPLWAPGVWCDQSRLTCQSYYSAIGRYCLVHNYIMFPLGRKICKILLQEYLTYQVSSCRKLESIIRDIVTGAQVIMSFFDGIKRNS